MKIIGLKMVYLMMLNDNSDTIHTDYTCTIEK